MLAVIAAIAFAVATILHLLHLDPYITWAFVYGGLTALAAHCVYPYRWGMTRR